MLSITPDLLLPAEFQLAEGPIWFDDRLWFVDSLAGHLHALEPDSRHLTTFEVGDVIGSAVPTAHDPDLWVISCRSGFAWFRLSTQSLLPILNPEPHRESGYFNDGKCDPAGRFLSGSLGVAGSCALYILDHELRVRQQVKGITTSNGMAWTPQGSTFYYIDSPTQRIDAFDYDLATGEMSGRRTVVKTPRALGNPDGMCLDAAGHLWVAQWDGGSVVCYDPASGEALATIHFPLDRPTSCCFGGGDWQTLYITTARAGLPAATLERTPAAGSIYHCRLEQPGRPPALFQPHPHLLP